MDTKLTLVPERATANSAKAYAHSHGTSPSRMVEGYFRAVVAAGSPRGPRTPLSASLQQRVWALAGDDLTNDLTIYFAANLDAWLSTDPRRLLVPETRPH
jgi:hypothetical protein